MTRAKLHIILESRAQNARKMQDNRLLFTLIFIKFAMMNAF